MAPERIYLFAGYTLDLGRGRLRRGHDYREDAGQDDPMRMTVKRQGRAGFAHSTFSTRTPT